MNQHPLSFTRIDQVRDTTSQGDTVPVTGNGAMARVQLLKQKLLQANQMIARLTEDNAELEQEVQISNELVDELVVQLTALKRLKGVEPPDLSEHEDRISQLEQELATSRDELRDLDQQHSALLDCHQQLAETNGQLQQQLSEIQESSDRRHELHQSQLVQAHQELDALKTQLERVAIRLEEEQQSNLALSKSHRMRVLQIRGLEYDVEKMDELKLENERLVSLAEEAEQKMNAALEAKQLFAERLAHSLSDRERLCSEKAKMEASVRTLKDLLVRIQEASRAIVH